MKLDNPVTMVIKVLESPRHSSMTNTVMHTYMVQFSFLDRRHFETVSLAFTHPYKDGCGWWAPFELLRRNVFPIAIIFNHGYLVGILQKAHTCIVWIMVPL